MKKKKIEIVSMLIVTFLLTIYVLPVKASERTNIYDDNSITIQEKIVSEEEYINAVAESNHLSYEEAKSLIDENRKIARIDPETVVDINRSISKKINNDFELKCTVYLEVVRDNMNHDYIEILAVRAPNVSLVGPHVNAKLGSAALEAEVVGTKEAKVYCNGNIEYTIPSNISTSFSFPGVGVSSSVGYNMNYTYSVSEIFDFKI